MPTIAPSPISRIARWPASPWAACRPEQITLANLDKFSHIGIFSGGSIAPTNITDMDAFKQKVKLVFVSYGSREVDPGNRRGGGRGGFGGDPKANTEALKAAGINSVITTCLRRRLTSGSPGGAACINSPRCCSRINYFESESLQM